MKAILIISFILLLLSFEINRREKKKIVPEVNPQKRFLLIDSVIFSFIVIVWSIVIIFGIVDIYFIAWSKPKLTDFAKLFFLLTYPMFIFMAVYHWSRYLAEPKKLSGKDWFRYRMIK